MDDVSASERARTPGSSRFGLPISPEALEPWTAYNVSRHAYD